MTPQTLVKVTGNVRVARQEERTGLRQPNRATDPFARFGPLSPPPPLARVQERCRTRVDGVEIFLQWCSGGG